MRSVQVLAAVAALVVATGVGEAVAGSHATKVSACVNSHGKIVSAKGKHCAKGSHAVALPTTAAAAQLPTVMPPGRTATGVWQVSGPVSAATQYIDSTVSFAVPFAVAPEPVIVTATTNPAPADCKGSLAKPSAVKGFVCVYVASAVHVSALTAFSPITNVIGTATKFGWGLYATSSGAGNLVANGTWAATA
jgi:hypothetical protein